MSKKLIEDFYLYSRKKSADILLGTIPYFRRSLRFCALPFLFFYDINWAICPRSRLYVAWDLLYIFFRFKYYPENYSLCHLWEKDRASWRNYYASIYDAYQRGRLRKEVHKKEYEVLFEDKNVCYQLCKAAELPLPVQYETLNPSADYRSVLRTILKESPSTELIVKDAFGKGGSGIFMVNKDVGSGEILVSSKDGQQMSLDKFVLNNYSVVQERVVQHPDLSKVSLSTNTCRIVTMRTKSGKVIILGALMRFSGGDSFVDNASSGGIAVGVDLDTGRLKPDGFDFKSRTFQSHPVSKIIFDGFQVPEWDDVISLAKKIQNSFSYYPLLGHDLAITSDGATIIEINAAHDNILLEMCCGPILEKAEVRAAFEEYNLIIN